MTVVLLSPCSLAKDVLMERRKEWLPIVITFNSGIFPMMSS